MFSSPKQASALTKVELSSPTSKRIQAAVYKRLAAGLLACFSLATATAQPKPAPAQRNSTGVASAPATSAAVAYTGIGRSATPAEIAAWDIDVRPDFKGLPPGQGSVAQGQAVWEAKCASCHGVFGENNETFAPLVGGTTAADIASGRTARLTDAAYPGRTTMMKAAYVSTLWDYIRRAMPWNAPKSLSHDEVYAATAYMLHLAGVLPENFVLSQATMAQAQARMPNRNGLTLAHSLWPGKGLTSTRAPDVRASACMRDCRTEPTVASLLPDYARNAHGNLAEQNREVGPQLGADTSRPEAARGARPALTASGSASKPTAASAGPGAALALAQKSLCTACHQVDRKVVGPSLREIGEKYGNSPEAVATLAQKIVAGGVGVWGTIPMPAQNLRPEDAKALAQWIAQGAP